MAELNPNIPLASAFTPVDVVAGAQRGMALQQNEIQTQDMQAEHQDKKYIQDYLKSGGDLYSEEGIKKAAETLKGKVTPGAYMKLNEYGTSFKTKQAELSAKLAEMDEAKFGQLNKITDTVHAGLQGPLQTYKQTWQEIFKKEHPGEDPAKLGPDNPYVREAKEKAAPAFKAAQQAQMQMISQQFGGNIPPQYQPIVKKMSEMDPESAQAAFGATTFSRKLQADETKRRMDEARAKQYEATAKESLEGKDLTEVMAIDERIAALDPEKDAEAIKRLEELRANRIKHAAGKQGAAPVEANMTPQAIDFVIDRMRSGDDKAMANLGRGAQGAANLTAINNRLAQRAQAEGWKPEDLVQARTQVAGARAGLVALGQRQAKLDTAAAEVYKFADNALAALDKVSRGDLVPVNDIMAKIKKGTGSPEEVTFATYVQSLANAYAAVITRGAPTTDASLKEAEKIIHVNMSKPQFKAMIEALKVETKAAFESVGVAAEHIKKEGFPQPKGRPTEDKPAADKMRVDPATQKDRDGGRQRILEDEMAGEQQKLAELEKRSKAATTNDELTAAGEEKNRVRANIAALEKELAPLKKKADPRTDPNDPRIKNAQKGDRRPIKGGGEAEFDGIGWKRIN